MNNIKIILVQPKNPGNIGAVARAMKTMGLSQLVLIKPENFPHKDAYIRATHAVDIIENCTIADTLIEVVQECQVVIGTSTRDRGDFIPTLTAKETADMLVNESTNTQTALIFGTESHGMTGSDLRICNYYGYIPANPEFSSLNLGSAVQTFCYEIYQSFLHQQKNTEIKSKKQSYPDHQQLQYFYHKLEAALLKIGFIRPKHPGIILQRLRGLFNRARINDKELKILQGIVSAIDNHETKK